MNPNTGLEYCGVCLCRFESLQTLDEKAMAAEYPSVPLTALEGALDS
jgi:hypothetical protein